MAQLSIYTEGLLSGDRIRLLDIHPATDPEHRIECSCYSVDLRQTPPYEALSYVWGRSLPAFEISCNAETATIGESLHSALKRLRLSDSARTIWADAICINQCNDNEKSIQVPLMGRIYGQATRVLVWLGHGDTGHIQTVKQAVEHVGNACQRFDGRENLLSVILEKQASVEDVIFTPDLCHSLRVLFLNSWFTRTWVIQEVHKGREALILWGTETMKWNDVGRTADWIETREVFTDFEERRAEVLKRLTDIPSGLARAMYDKSLLLSQPLLNTLYHARTFDATDPRDKVYGLLSLVSPVDEAQAIEVDYRKTVGEVFADTTLAIVRLYSLLSPLSYIRHPYIYEHSADFRSWAPNWSDPRNVRVPLNLFYETQSWRPALHHRVKHTEPQHMNSERLYLLGIKYETISSIAPAMLFEQKYIHGHDTSQLFHNCIAENLTLPASREEAERSRKYCLQIARTLLGGAAAGANEEVQIGLLVAMKASLLTGEAPNLNAQQQRLYDHAGRTCESRRIFFCEHGTVGLGPQCMRVGDVVVVLYGGQTPYVLRPLEDNKYAFMGDAYVDDIMDGEAVHAMERGELKEEDFCLV